MGIEEQIDKLIDLGEDIKSRLDRLVEIGESLEGHVRLPYGLELQSVADVLRDDTCISCDAVAEEPPKKWRILQVGEEVQEGDLVNCKLNPPSDPPDGDGWIDASICVGSEVAASDECVFARLVTEEPVKEPKPPSIDKPPEPEYREPALPADAGEQCEFSRDGKEWCKFLLAGWQVDNNPWICERYHCWPYARIKKDA